MRRPVLKYVVLAVMANGSSGATAVLSAPDATAFMVAAASAETGGTANAGGTGPPAVAAPRTTTGASVSKPPPEPAPAAGAHATLVPEPSGYWTGPTNSPVPATLSGAKVITDAHKLQALLDHQHPALIDVSKAPRRPDNMAPGAPWLPLPHHAIPGTLWIPGPGAGEVPAAVEAFFRQQLAKATHNDPTRPVVIYCHESCWLSWNAAKRAVSYGYQHVYWYRDGIEGWKAAGLPTAVIEPQTAPQG